MAVGGLVLIIISGIFWILKRKFHVRYYQLSQGKHIETNPGSLDSERLKQEYWEVILVMIPFIFPVNSEERLKRLKLKIVVCGVLSTTLYVFGIVCFYIKVTYPAFSKF